jgi:hypothetical protein
VERVEDRVALQGREVAGEGGAVGAAHDRAQVGQLPLAGRLAAMKASYSSLVRSKG